MNPKKIKILLYLPLALLFIANLFYYPLPVKAEETCNWYKAPDCAGHGTSYFNSDADTKCGANKPCSFLEFCSCCCQTITSNAAATTNPSATSASGGKASFTPQVGIGADFQAGKVYTPDGSTAMIGQYIRAIYKYAIGIVGILAAVVLMIGGVMWIVAGGNSTMIGEAKSWIGASLTGLILALCSYLILATVNPALVNLKTSTITPVITTPTATTTTAVVTGCCVNTSNPPASMCKATEQSACPTLGTQAWYKYDCSSDTMKNTCQQTASDCASQSDGTLCTPASPVTGSVYECSSGICNPCQKTQGLGCGTMKCCDTKNLKCQGTICMPK
jgi:hypothetical protein